MTERDPAAVDMSTDAPTGDTPQTPDPVTDSVEATAPTTDLPSAEEAGPSPAEPATTPSTGTQTPDAGVTTPRRGIRSRTAKPVPAAVRPVRAPIKVVRKSVEQTAALRESLAEKEAEAHDLRVSIEQLRQELNAEREQLSASRRRPFPWPWLVIGVLGVILLLWLLSMCTGSATTGAVTPSASGAATPAAATSAASSVASPARSTPAPSGPAASAAPSVATTPMRWAGSSVTVPPGLPTSGPGIDAPGVDVSYALDADGTSLDVFERVRLAAPQPSVTAALPSLAALRGDLAGAELAVDALQVELDGVAVRPTLTGSTWSAARPDGSAITTAVLRYRLTGAVVRLEPALAGRLAAVVTPITAAGALGADQPVTVRVIAANVRSLTCPTAGTQVICGTVSPTGATATVPKGSQPVLQLQFDKAS